MDCINCLNFKYKKGWERAYCTQGRLMNNKGHDILFKRKTGTGLFLEKRHLHLKKLHPENCSGFNDMGKREGWTFALNRNISIDKIMKEW